MSMPWPCPPPFPRLQDLIRRGIARFGAVLVALGLIALVWASLLTALSDQREAARQGAARNVENLARVFSDSLFQSFTAMDRSLLSLRATYLREQAIFDIRHWMATSPPLTDLPGQFVITDRNGFVIGSTATAPDRKISIGDRDYFLALRDSGGDPLVLTKPITGRASKESVIVLARKRLTPGVGFDGVVFATISTADLARFDAAVELGKQGVVALVGMDGIVRARGGGAVSPDDSSVGRSLAAGRLMQMITQAPAGTFTAVSVLDGVSRIFAYRRLRALPLIVTVGIAESEAMARFNESARVQIGLAGGLTVLGLVILAMYLARDRQMRRTSDMLRAQYTEKSRLLKSTLEHMTHGIVMVDPDSRIAVFNQQYVETFQLPPELMQGSPMVEDVLRFLWARGEYGDVGDFAAWSQRSGAQVRHTEGLTVTEHTRPDGTVLEVRTNLLPDGAAVRTFSDITGRKQEERLLRAAVEEADRATRVKSTFLATMSHEIRSPLSGLLGVLEMLRATPLDDEQSRMARMIDSSGRMLLAVLNDVLDFSKIEAGALAITAEPTALHVLLDEMVQPHVGPGRHKGIEVTLAIDPSVPPHVTTDPLRLRQILGNLLSNAMKFTTAGSVAVRADLAREGDAATLRIVVSDSGIGMDAAALARLFQPFMQADDSTTRKYGGSGLGLSISQKLAGLMGGGLTVTSTPGVGSAFTLALPCIACAAPASAALPASAAPEPVAPAGLRALLVDDDPTNRWLGQRQLQRLGFRVDIAEDGQAGLTAALAAPYDVVVTDLHMPRLDGVGMTLALRAAEGDGRRVPIIGLTADATSVQRERCQAAGLTRVAIKPLTGPRLAELLAEILPAAAPPPAATTAAAGTAPKLLAVPFDSQIFLEMFEPSDPDGARWLRDYLTTARAHAGDLASADPVSLPAIAHRLAGASFSAGAITVGLAARALERAARSGDAGSALPGLVSAVAVELAAAELAISDFLGEHAPAIAREMPPVTLPASAP